MKIETACSLLGEDDSFEYSQSSLEGALPGKKISKVKRATSARNQRAVRVKKRLQASSSPQFL